MKEISIIADTGIQFLEFKVNFTSNSKLLKIKQEISFIEEDGTSLLVIPKYDEVNDCYINMMDPSEKIEEHQIYTIKAEQALSCFEGNWLPIPIFTENHNATKRKYDNGPFGWARVWIAQLPSDEKFTHSIILSLDTKYDKEGKHNIDHITKEDKHMSLSGSDNQNCTFSLAEDITEIDEFIGEPWVENTLLDISKNGAKLAGIKESNFNENPWYHVGLYLALLKVLKAAKVIPDIGVFFPKENKNIEVDLILDIGNSRSCGLLLETSQTEANHSFSFSNASILKLRNMQQPSITYDDAFEMRCEFVRVDFGKINIPEWKNCFEWPSIVRVGIEASNRSISAGRTGVLSGMSSPKRYLWDNDKRKTPWYYNPGNIHVKAEMLGTGNSFLSSIPIDSNGKISDIPHMKSQYSRKSLMTFALVEIILQAATYVNSYEFREKKGNEKLKRILNRIVLTTPTAMLNTDKKTFRECANEAVEILQMYYGKEINGLFKDLVVLPSAKDVITNPDEYEDLDRMDKKEWGYDEATCSQLSFMYGEITGRYQNNSKLFFEIEGKKRELSEEQFQEIGNLSDFNFDVNDNAVTVASLDIGGGTTDLMICTYRNESSATTSVITPFPEFYEGFNLAGDDILKRIIERVIVPTIRKKADELDCRDSASVINFLFGENVGEHSEKNKEYRKLFAHQVLLPLAMYALNHSKEERQTIAKTYEEVMFELGNVQFASKTIVSYVDDYMHKVGVEKFEFKKIQFIFDLNEINSVVTQVVQPMLFKLSGIISQFECDYLLLAGRPTTLPVIRNIINSYLPISPDKVIPLGNYRIGQWYPFAKGNGLITDPKTTVVVGAAIGLMAGSLGRLEGFRLNTTFLKNNVKSTAKYIGAYDTKNKTVLDTWFAEQDEEEILFDGPMFIGMKQMDIDNWISTPMYKIMYKDNGIAQALINKLPLKVLLERNESNPEVIWGGRGRLYKAKEISDKDGNKLANDSLIIKPQTLINEDGYWIDTGSFHLSMF